MRELIIAIGIGIMVSATSTAQTQPPTAATGQKASVRATANLVDGQGRSVGDAQLEQTPRGVLIRLNLKNAPAGIHGLHIHEVGQCEGPSFESAGGHFNPSKHQHGFLNPRGAHGGDLPNIEVPATALHSVEYFAEGLTLDQGSNSLLDRDGSALVIHSGRDDYSSDPAGNSGDRVVCGSITGSTTSR
jgi:superoxide dismutase, Cu-Zn family